MPFWPCSLFPLPKHNQRWKLNNNSHNNTSHNRNNDRNMHNHSHNNTQIATFWVAKRPFTRT